MAVTTNTPVIFCEGKNQGLDQRLVERILEQIPGYTPTIVPAGGKFTFTQFAQGYFFPNQLSQQQYLVFRDRDFDTRIC